MPTTTAFDFGDVVLIRFPFTDQAGHKQRPAAVVSSTLYHDNRLDVILLAITSQVRSPSGLGEAMISDWRSAGLLKPSCFKPVLFTAEKSLIRRGLGTLPAADQRALREVLKLILG